MGGMTTAKEEIVERIKREGPIGFDTFVELALYGEGGFFTRARGAGRAGRDFVTSPEVGQLFGALVARALDGWWRDAGAPDPFLVIEAGAGRGRLAADVLAAAPECTPALRYVLVDRSPGLRAAQRDLLTVEPFEDALGPMAVDDEDAPVPVTGMGPIVTALDELPAVALDGVVFANELLDNLPFRVVERRGGAWWEIRVAVDGDALVESPVPAATELATDAELVVADAPDGARVPVPTGLVQWLRQCAGALRRGRLVVVDYMATGAELVERGQVGWLRTYRDHGRGALPLVAAGERDITIDVPREYLVHAATPRRVPARARHDAGRVAGGARRRRRARRRPPRVGCPRPRRRSRGDPPPEPGDRGRRARRSGRPRRPSGPRVHPLSPG